jgi:hypothetical protein
MKWTLFVVGLLVGAAGMFGAMRLMAASRQPFDSNEIVFAEKAFSDSRQVQQDSWVAISGTLTGDGLAHPNKRTPLDASGIYMSAGLRQSNK